MPKQKLSNLTLYRRRYMIGYAAVTLALLALLLLALVIPGGLTPAERQSVVTAETFHVVGINAPYYLLQKASIGLLGLSVVSVKLPSLVLGGLLGAGLFLLLRRWLTLSIAVFSALIIFSGVTFLSLVGTGSPQILYVLYPVLLIYFGTRVLAHDRGLIVFSLLLLATIAAALLTPSMAYLVVLALVIASANPHVRYGFRRLPVYGLALLAIGFLASLAPLAYLVVRHPPLLWQVLAVPHGVTTDIGANLSVLLLLYGRFLHPGLTSGMPAPVVGLATLGLALLGAYRIIRSIYTARAQFIAGWSVIAAVLALVDPGFGILLYLPLVLLAALGLSHLAAIWYRTFPLNPYARVLALLPIGVLISGIVFGGLTRYVTTVTYAPGSPELYSRDLTLLQDAVRTSYPKGPVTLYVPEGDIAFYSILTRGAQPVITAVRPLADLPKAGDHTVATTARDEGMLIRIVTDSRAHGSDRFYLYK